MSPAKMVMSGFIRLTRSAIDRIASSLNERPPPTWTSESCAIRRATLETSTDSYDNRAMAATEHQITHSLVKALRRVPGFDSLDDKTLLTIVGASSNLFWRADSVVFEKDTPADALYIVLSGSARVLLDDRGATAAIGPGDFFGELSLLLDTMHSKRV